jgi:hypothetical protein
MTKRDTQSADYATEVAGERKRLEARAEELRLVCCESYRKHQDNFQRLLEANRALEAHDAKLAASEKE